MKNKRRRMCISLALVLLCASGGTACAPEPTLPDKDGFATDVILSQEEYIEAVAAHENISYTQAEEKIAQTRAAANADPEQVVTILKTLKKTAKGEYALKCSAYLDVLKDSETGEYLEIIGVNMPAVDMSGPECNATMSGAIEAEISGTRATLYCNGGVEYLVASAAVSEKLPGVYVRDGTAGTVFYKYDISNIFTLQV